jgi:hypothetical protein
MFELQNLYIIKKRGAGDQKQQDWVNNLAKILMHLNCLQEASGTILHRDVHLKVSHGFYCCTVHVVIIAAFILVYLFIEIVPRQELQTHIQTDGNDIRPHTVQTHNERTSMESNLVTAQVLLTSPLKMVVNMD